jgi:hypothetical protein
VLPDFALFTYLSRFHLAETKVLKITHKRAADPKSLLKKSLFRKDDFQKWGDLSVNVPLFTLSSYKKAVFAPGVGDFRTAISW